jgi:hypothetical protein
VIALYPLIQLRIAFQRPDGDVDHDVIATCSGIPKAQRGELFDLVLARLHYAGIAAGISLTVADEVWCEPSSLTAMARVLEDRVAATIASERAA